MLVDTNVSEEYTASIFSDILVEAKAERYQSSQNHLIVMHRHH
jgi:hypothetical protein